MLEISGNSGVGVLEDAEGIVFHAYDAKGQLLGTTALPIGAP